ncbi:rho guanine nucleotide exchange factor 17, partial [Brachionus plicatilis]
MTSRWKFSTETKRSVSINSSKPFGIISPKSKLSMLSSFPFRYPFASDGCTTSNTTTSTSPQHNSPQSVSNASSLVAEETNSSSLGGTYCSGFDSGSNDEILFKKPDSCVENPSNILKAIDDKKTNLFFVQGDDDYDDNRRNMYEEKRDVFMDTFRHDKINPLETVQSELTLFSTNTLPNRYFDDSSGLKRYGVRRHHSAPQPDAKWLQAKRQAIVVQMYDTEKSYVEALKILVNKYYLPLKEKDIVDRNLINDIFYKIPEIHVHHELFLSWLKTKFDTWDSHQTIGDILFNIFAKQSVIETYISFVNNYRTSQEAIRISKEQSSIFCKFLEQQTRDHRGKLTLKDLIIQPVQRIPRYELYIKDFLKCTPPNHPDHQYLIKAQTELHNLAEKIDQVHKEVNDSYGSDSLAVLQIIQDLVENLDDLVTAYRYYIRHDMLTIVSSSGMKKDRCLFLFSDLVILTSCKRRSGNINKKPNTIILNSPIGKQYLENSKHKLIMKFQLEDIDLTNNILTKKLSIEKDFLEEDLNMINRINEIAKNISYPHQ